MSQGAGTGTGTGGFGFAHRRVAEMPRRFCASFRPPSRAQQLAAIGLDAGGDRPTAALCRCLDPSGGEWEDLDKPQPHEWLEAMLDKTPDQSFKAFLDSRPNLPDKIRNTICLQPLCEPADLDGPAFPEGPWPSWQALESAVKAFYHPLKVRTLPAIPMEMLSPRPKSRQGSFGMQWHAAEVLDALARSAVPREAFCTLAVTMCDLYPREEWNFVYGLARLSGRVGVFSFARHTPCPSLPEPFREGRMLHQSMKTMLHEIGHMFGLKHCTWFNCLMRGSNGAEVEHQPNYLHLCPVCLRKLHSSIGFDVPSTYANLLKLFEGYEAVSADFRVDCDFLRKRLAALQDLPPGASRVAKAAARIGTRLPRGDPASASAGGAAAKDGSRALRRAASAAAAMPSSAPPAARASSPQPVPLRRAQAGSPPPRSAAAVAAQAIRGAEAGRSAPQAVVALPQLTPPGSSESSERGSPVGGSGRSGRGSAGSGASRPARSTPAGSRVSLGRGARRVVLA